MKTLHYQQKLGISLFDVPDQVRKYNIQHDFMKVWARQPQEGKIYTWK